MSTCLPGFSPFPVRFGSLLGELPSFRMFSPQLLCAREKTSGRAYAGDGEEGIESRAAPARGGPHGRQHPQNGQDRRR